APATSANGGSKPLRCGRQLHSSRTYPELNQRRESTTSGTPLPTSISEKPILFDLPRRVLQRGHPSVQLGEPLVEETLRLRVRHRFVQSVSSVVELVTHCRHCPRLLVERPPQNGRPSSSPVSSYSLS